MNKIRLFFLLFLGMVIISATKPAISQDLPKAFYTNKVENWNIIGYDATMETTKNCVLERFDGTIGFALFADISERSVSLLIFNKNWKFGDPKGHEFAADVDFLMDDKKNEYQSHFQVYDVSALAMNNIITNVFLPELTGSMYMVIKPGKNNPDAHVNLKGISEAFGSLIECIHEAEKRKI